MELKGLRALTARLKGMQARAVKTDVVSVGFLENATPYPDGTATATIAAIQEFGSGRIPSRPFFRNMIAQDSPGWGASMAALLAANGYDADQTLQSMGMGISGQLRASIIALVDPPLSPRTIAARAARYKTKRPPTLTLEKPLIDSGHLLGSIDFKVEPE